MSLNSVKLSGVVEEVNKEFYTLKVGRKSGKENLIRVWGNEEEVESGKRVSLIGELDCMVTGMWNTKMILGVKSTLMKYVSEENDTSRVFFSGQIMSKGTVKKTVKGESILILTLKINHHVFVPVVLWNHLAENVSQFCKAGDEVEIDGFLVSREYDTSLPDGSKYKGFTTEVSCFGLKRI